MLQASLSFKYLIMKGQCLEDLYISVNHCFLKEENMMFPNYAEVKDSKGKIDQYIAVLTDDKELPWWSTG